MNKSNRRVKNRKESDEKSSKLKSKTPTSFKEPELVMRWIEKKIEVSNGLKIAFEYDSCQHVKFELWDEDASSEGYQELLQAKIYDTFGITDINVASNLVTNCLNAMISFPVDSLNPSKEEKLKAYLEHCFSYIISLFREFRPHDPFEAMMISKLIILDLMSVRAFAAANSSEILEQKTTYITRGIKLTRLWCEIKEKLDKHRKPDQKIMVQYNHVHNEGHAIIGSHLKTRGRGK